VTTPLPSFLFLYGALFAAFGVASPFLPGLLKQDGLSPSAIGVVLAAGTAIRLISGPLGGRLADRTGRAPLILTGFTAASALVAFGYIPARGFLALTVISVAHAFTLAPLTPLADALALGSAREGRFQYGWVRGAGSAAFIAGTLLSGLAVSRYGLGAFVWMNATLLALAATLGWRLPNRMAGIEAISSKERADRGSIAGLLRNPVFVRLMVVASLILGSHALHDSFEVIRWRAAGMSPAKAGILWSISVGAELLVFLLLGRPLLDRLGPARALMLAAIAGVIRWSAAARTALFPILIFVEPLHGLSYALMHLACMEVIGTVVAAPLAATAQAFYTTVATGAVAAAVTLMSGPLYGRFGAGAFWAMAAMCVIALPIASTLQTLARNAGRAHP
jgi:PPP family 3-phenylpropionic acid transporter